MTDNHYTQQQKDLNGLKGWLILVGFGLIFKPVYLIVSLVPIYQEIFSSTQWEIITTEGAQTYGHTLVPFIIGESLINIFLFVAAFYLLYLFFTKHYLFPKIFIFIAGFTFIFVLIDAWVGAIILKTPFIDNETGRELFRSGIYAIIWIPYMYVSKRVKATFVKGKTNEELST
ncbi:MAG: DUF2569 domain-containing protein [Campylobacterales bacterium]|nr:DUF2569 domain-containing protein [Campylobacterales bacterium]